MDVKSINERASADRKLRSSDIVFVSAFICGRKINFLIRVPPCSSVAKQ